MLKSANKPSLVFWAVGPVSGMIEEISKVASRGSRPPEAAEPDPATAGLASELASKNPWFARFVSAKRSP